MVDEKMTREQTNALISVLDDAMHVLRDDAPLNGDDLRIGKVLTVDVDKSSDQILYKFKNGSLRNVSITLLAGPDPLNYAENRSDVPIVPVTLRIQMLDSAFGVSRLEIERKLDLAKYWIDTDGIKHDGNDMGAGAPPSPLLHRYRYRANPHVNSHFPVDVELFYGDPPPDDSSSGQSLIAITLERAYSYLTPAMRKQKREEAAARANAAYGKSRGAEQ
ncbi:hypothetical protein G3N59_07915 [Paraburkholderia sp. Ac-20340]|uniref:hypothetical protein n=1 Tax=Paraburkholderia sp. Ac-20340 TaxID=2703888 RepID=UPI0019817350|nr:hypothetical protein [Paraburkholderia sp. Ac-20340]MBN3853298.1 hypothetical protein [Paraburkholderia sp. Ac-20340]